MIVRASEFRDILSNIRSSRFAGVLELHFDHVLFFICYILVLALSRMDHSDKVNLKSGHDAKHIYLILVLDA